MSAPVLAVRLRALGDVVLATPALRALRRGHPDAPLDVVTDPRYAPLLAGLPYVRRVHALGRGDADAWLLARRLRRERYAWAVDLFGNPRSALLVALAGATRTAGYDLRGRRHAYAVRVPVEPARADGRREYAAAVHVRLAEAAGGVPDGLHTDVALDDAARAAGLTLLERAGVREPRRAVAVVAAGTWPTKTWPVSESARLARRLIGAGWEALLVSAPGEEAVRDTLRALVPRIAVLPDCDVRGMAASLAPLAGLVGTDSGPRHVAAALGLPTFAWFGPTHPDTWQPPGERHGFWQAPLPCAGCDRTRCPHWNCLPGLDGERAADLVLAHLARHADGRG
ncbi:MAG: glycosyltransferase family 9 protein [Candidatus Eisenbacteria bacterium]